MEKSGLSLLPVQLALPALHVRNGSLRRARRRNLRVRCLCEHDTEPDKEISIFGVRSGEKAAAVVSPPESVTVPAIGSNSGHVRLILMAIRAEKKRHAFRL